MSKKELFCPLEATSQVLGGKWTIEILWHLLEGSIRPSELRRRIPKLSERMLINRLKFLEDEGLVKRKVYDQIPPKVEYSMTAYGKTLTPVLKSMEEWGVKHMKATGRKSRKKNL